MTDAKTTFAASGNHVSLIRETPSRIPFGKAAQETVSFDDWLLTRPAAAAAVVAHVLQAIDDGETADDGAPMVVDRRAKRTPLAG